MAQVSITKANLLNEKYTENGFTTLPFPQDLRKEMLRHIDAHIRELGAPYLKPGAPAATLEQIAAGVPDEVWSKKMHRGFRMFPKTITDKLQKWAHLAVSKEFGKSVTAVNAVDQKEVEMNPKITKESLAIYWRCVRPGKPDAGRPHRDATFWVLELEQGYDPKIPFPFDYIKDSIKIWIPLQGCTPKTTLQIIPRSHKMDLPIAVDETEYGRRPNIERNWLEAHEKDFMSPIELSQGSCIIFDMDLVHRGPTHNNSELRISAEFTIIVK